MCVHDNVHVTFHILLPPSPYIFSLPSAFGYSSNGFPLSQTANDDNEKDYHNNNCCNISPIFSHVDGTGLDPFPTLTGLCYEPPRPRLNITTITRRFPFRMSARVGGSSVRVCFGCAMFVSVVRCFFWLCDVCFGGAMFVLAVRWEGWGFLSACLLVFTAAVPLGSVLCLFHLFFLFGSPQ